MSDKKFEAIVAAAEEAGMKALAAKVPTPMVVGTPTTLFGSTLDRSKPMYYEAGGVCGFAWIKIKGNTAFGRYIRKAGKARPGYPSGLEINVTAGGQSMERKEAYAQAYAKVLNDNGIWAYADSRMD